MKKILFIACAVACLLTALTTFPVHAQIKLPRLIRDSMVLQRDTRINIWGWASNGEKITVQFNGRTYRTRTAGNGEWRIQLSPTPAGGPYTMEINGKNRIVLQNILIGDVWICSGQSNMVHQLQLHSVRYQDEIDHANYPEIRHFWIPTMTDLQAPHPDLPAGSWKSANPRDVLDFSAVAYFFAKDLYEKYHIPIGLINASVGGSPIEAWISRNGCKPFPDLLRTIDKNKDTAYVNGLSRRGPGAGIGAGMTMPMDKGLAGPILWYDPAYIPKGWRPIGVPGYWEDQGISDLDGAVWYRKEIDVPASMTSRPAKVFLGRIVDEDFFYLNGQLVGNTTYLYPQRRYVLPAGLLRPGKNVLVIRVINHSGKGGFVPDKPYSLIAGQDTIDLKGYWQYKVGEVYAQRSDFNGVSGSGFSAQNQRFSEQNQPAALYNAMLAPATHYTIKGFLWYQGESNTGRAAGYAKLQPALIADWRDQWQQGDLPFLYVQLPGFGDYHYLPVESHWAELREAQLHSLSVPHTAMAVAIDLGEWNDIHPDRKKEVGHRLALTAAQLAYGDDLVSSGPLYRSATVKDGKMILSFDDTGGGLITQDGEDPQEFAIAGADKKFVWANVRIEGDQVVVWSDAVKDPKYIRYAWADDPVNPNLYNKEGLPASPFRTGE